jgi:hypothetical protein
VAHLEQKLESLETRIRKLSSSVNSTDPDGLPKSPGKATPEHAFSPPVVRMDSGLAMSSNESDPWKARLDSSQDGQTGNAVETLDYDLQRKAANTGGDTPIYRGRTTGLEVLRGLRSLCDFLVDPKMISDHAATKMIDSLNSTPPNQHHSVTSAPNLLFLSEAFVHKWVRLAFDEAFVLWPFIDRHAFEAYAQHLLERGTFSQDDNNSDHLGLFHAVMAIGQRHDPDLIGLRNTVSDFPETRG